MIITGEIEMYETISIFSYKTAFCVGLFFAAFWVVAYLSSWVAQWVWAWVDDAEVSDKNWLSEKVTFTKYKYHLYNQTQSRIDAGMKADKPFAYSNKKELHNTSAHGKIHEEDYIYDHELKAYHFLGFILSWFFAPIVLLLALDFYPVVLFIGAISLIAFLARFARRHKKLFDKHVVDKDAHKQD